jgi:hypothetical protein
MWHGRASSAKGGASPSGLSASARIPASQGGFPLFCRQNAAALNLADACLLPDHSADEAFLWPEAVPAEPGRSAIVFAAGRCGVDGQARILPSGQDDSEPWQVGRRRPMLLSNIVLRKSMFYVIQNESG